MNELKRSYEKKIRNLEFDLEMQKYDYEEQIMQQELSLKSEFQNGKKIK